MVITILEAQLDLDRGAILQASFKEAIQNLDEGIIQTFLLQNPRNLNQWCIETIWKSSEALNEMRKKEEPPKGVAMFREAGAEPKLSIFNVVEHSEIKI
jgi:heme-degrading monooxygenase HmoA